LKYNPYSISKLGTFETCPKKFKFHYIDKIKIDAPQALALQKGNYIHEIIEEDYNYDVPRKTNDIFTIEEKENAKEIVRNFENSELGQKYKEISHNNPTAKHEEKFGFKIVDRGLELCPWDSKDTWIRGALDFQYREDYIHYNIDWKSGKDKSQDEFFGINQSKAYSIFLLLKHPEIDTVVSKFVFIEHATEKSITYTRDKLSDYIRDFYMLTKEVEDSQIFKENISALCDYCDFYNHGFCSAPEEAKQKTEEFKGTKISLDF
jgi:hypothetical protein